jgi:hypothetical protein
LRNSCHGCFRGKCLCILEGSMRTLVFFQAKLSFDRKAFFYFKFLPKFPLNSAPTISLFCFVSLVLGTLFPFLSSANGAEQ